MGKNLEKLLSAAGPALSVSPVVLGDKLLGFDGSALAELVKLLRKRNGFYALESALHVFPSDSLSGVMGLDKWNSDSLWRSSYGDLAVGCLFFAEDVFGGQFCVKDGVFCCFDPETGGMEKMADSIDAWAAAILSDYEVLTGYPLAHAWQEQHGVLPADKRLVPKVPFTVGGEYQLENLHVVDATRGMRLRGELAAQIRDLPDGSEIKFRIVD